jgi:catechol-2,3-dioxygenase
LPSRAGRLVSGHFGIAAIAEEYLVSDSIKFGGVTLDCPHAGELATFYAEITGGKVTLADDSWAMVTCPDGSDICFQTAPGYTRPNWPDPTSSMQMHLDFDVDDLDSAETTVLAAGATKYEVQPNDHCRVYADPAGHPFCLSTYQALNEQA